MRADAAGAARGGAHVRPPHHGGAPQGQRDRVPPAGEDAQHPLQQARRVGLHGPAGRHAQRVLEAGLVGGRRASPQALRAQPARLQPPGGDAQGRPGARRARGRHPAGPRGVPRAPGRVQDVLAAAAAGAARRPPRRQRAARRRPGPGRGPDWPRQHQHARQAGGARHRGAGHRVHHVNGALLRGGRGGPRVQEARH